MRGQLTYPVENNDEFRAIVHFVEEQIDWWDAIEFLLNLVELL